jgi:L-threonylcarbamoyladenylate synthase
MATAFQYRLAAHIIHRGGVIACPTDTIYGLACDPFDFDAVTRVMQVKQRSANKNFILLASGIEQAESLIVINDEERERILSTTRPTSWIATASDDTPDWLLDNNGSVTIRVSRHPNVSRLCDATGHAVISTSANLSGKRPARNIMQLHQYFNDDIDLFLANDCKTDGRPSKVIRLCDNYVFR